MTDKDRLATVHYPSAGGVPTPEATVVELGKRANELMLQDERRLIALALGAPRRPGPA